MVCVGGRSPVGRGLAWSPEPRSPGQSLQGAAVWLVLTPSRGRRSGDRSKRRAGPSGTRSCPGQRPVLGGSLQSGERVCRREGRVSLLTETLSPERPAHGG